MVSPHVPGHHPRRREGLVEGADDRDRAPVGELLLFGRDAGAVALDLDGAPHPAPQGAAQEQVGQSLAHPVAAPGPAVAVPAALAAPRRHQDLATGEAQGRDDLVLELILGHARLHSQSLGPTFRLRMLARCTARSRVPKLIPATPARARTSFGRAGPSSKLAQTKERARWSSLGGLPTFATIRSF